MSEIGGGDPSKTHKPGEKLSVKVMNLDPTRRRISLSIEGAKESALHGEYMEYVAETKKTAEASEGKSAMALAFERAMGGKK
jgi:ribosomal protein S1